MKTKLRKGSVQQKKTEKDTDDLRKIVSLAYPAFAMFAKTFESAARARRAEKLPAHLDQAIISAESFEERDALCRRLSSHCYQLSKWFMKSGDYKMSARYMNLALRFLRLSMDPKKQAVDEKFSAELERLEKKMQEIKEQQPNDLE